MKLSLKLKCGIVTALCLIAMLGTSVLAAPAPSFTQELQERVEGSPLEAFTLLHQALQDGVIYFELTTESQWVDSYTEFTLHSNLARLEFVLDYYNRNRRSETDFTLFANRERIAFTDEELGDFVFGITFATFEEDLAALYQELAANNQSIRLLSNIKEVLEELDALGDFYVVGMHPTHTRADALAMIAPFLQIVEIGIDEVTTPTQATRFSVEFYVRDVANLLIELAKQSDIPQLVDLAMDIEPFYEDDDYKVYLAAYVCDTGRLLQVWYAFTHTATWTEWWSGERTERSGESSFALTFNFGENARDTWSMAVETQNRWGHDSFKIEWDVVDTDYGIDHIFSVFERERIVHAWLVYTDFTTWLAENNMYHYYTTFVAATADEDFWDELISQFLLTVDPMYYYSMDILYDEFIDWLYETDNLHIYLDVTFWHLFEMLSLWEEFVTSFDPVAEPTFTLSIHWNATSHDLTLVTKNNWRENILTGTMQLESGQSFELFLLEDSDNFTEALSLHARRGATAPTTEFINLDQWARYYHILTGNPEAMQAYELLQPVSAPTVAMYASANIATVNSKYLYLRRGPGVSYAAFNHLAHGNTVTVLETRGTWVRVETERGTGWVFGRYLDM